MSFIYIAILLAIFVSWIWLFYEINHCEEMSVEEELALDNKLNMELGLYRKD